MFYLGSGFIDLRNQSIRILEPLPKDCVTVGECLMKKECYLVSPKTIEVDQYSDFDEWVRCLCFICKRLREIAIVPAEAEILIVAVKYTGPAYPGIGLRDGDEMRAPEDWYPITSDIEAAVDAYIQRIGLAHTLEKSAGELLRWNDVLREGGIAVA